MLIDYSKVSNNTRCNKKNLKIYERDKGICIVCNEFVNINEFDLGHLIDACCGGSNNYDNLAVMHRRCNQTKPRHKTLEEFMKWKLTYTIPEYVEGSGFTLHDTLKVIGLWNNNKPDYSKLAILNTMPIEQIRHLNKNDFFKLIN
jgi:hypothetical protein